MSVSSLSLIEITFARGSSSANVSFLLGNFSCQSRMEDLEYTGR